MKRNKRIALATVLAICVAATMVVAQIGLQDGKKLYDHSQDHFILPSGQPNAGSSPGNGQGAITTVGGSVYIYLNGQWCKATVATPTPTPTPSATATATSTPTATATATATP